MTTTDQDDTAAPSRASLLAALFPMIEELPRVPRQARSRGKRDELVRAAARVFVARGFTAATADDIAAAANVSVGSFYNYFKNKKQILLALVVERIEGIFSNLRLTEMDLMTTDQRGAIHQAVSATLSADADVGLRRVWRELLALEPDLAPYQRIIGRYILDRLEERIGAAAQRGLTWPGLDVPATALTILALMEGLASRPAAEIVEARLVDAVTDCVIHTLFPPAS